MNCEQLRAKLDAYMDGELSDVELREMEAHAATCESCRLEFQSARLVRETLADLPEEVAVPLDVQAGWRRAVREEAKRGGVSSTSEHVAANEHAAAKPKRRWLRAVYAVAAALVLVIGASAMMNGVTDRMSVRSNSNEMESMALDEVPELPAPLAAAALPTSAVIASDGEIANAEFAPDEAYAARREYIADDLDGACASVEALVEEYSGSCTSERSAGGATYRVELPREYLDDFLSAVSHVGAEQEAESADAEGDTAVVYIQIDEAE